MQQCIERPFQSDTQRFLFYCQKGNYGISC